MVEGGIELTPDQRGSIINLKRSGRGEDARSLVISAHRRLDELDILAAARICADQGLRLSFESVVKGLRRNGFGREPRYVFMPFPFEKPSTWSCEHRWVVARTENGRIAKRRMITRIHAIDYDLGIDHIHVRYPGRTEAQEDDELNDTSTGRVRLRAKAPVSDDLRVITSRPSWSALEDLNIPSPAIRLAGKWTVEQTPVFLDDPGAAKTKHVALDDEIDTATTAGPGTKSERGKRPSIRINIKDAIKAKMDTPRPPSARITSTIIALQRLATDLNRQLDLIAPADELGNDPIDGLWRYPVDAKGKPGWSLTREGRPRRALVARLQSQSGWIYIFDAEHLDAEVMDAITGESRISGQDGYTCLCMVAVGKGEPLPPEMISDFLWHNAVAKGVWKRAPLHLPWQRLPRANAWFEDPATYARHMAKIVRRLEGGASQHHGV
ncbi:hypothetical protein CFHF_03755 [Caulobacter flavus]|uniref:Transposase n=2 Tax=Caulobacter flavus TaxID=1679497 RepID=A0A2N5CZ90_9CAUL|nr:hypothetical protein C1707_02415 [Caulobacter flavus]PLR19134.1 hypothetical protein CFHF_03755 [Caulobacter flavus]